MDCANIKIVNGLPLPCGKCFACQCSKRFAWAFRLYQEFKASAASAFVTLTYDDLHVPDSVFYRVKKTVQRTVINRKTGEVKQGEFKIYALETNRAVIFRKKQKYELKFHICNFHALNRFHVSKFLKDLQKFSKVKFSGQLTRYYLIGEYGDSETERPHYHALLFFPEQLDLENDFKSILTRIWDKGNVKIEQVTYGSINYVGKHQIKECAGNFYQRSESPIFARCSRYKGGLGKQYLTDSTLRFHLSNKKNNSYCISFGFRIPLPQFYRKKIWDENLTLEELQELQNDMLASWQRKLDFINRYRVTKLTFKDLFRINAERVRESKVKHDRQKYTRKYMRKRIENEFKNMFN